MVELGRFLTEMLRCAAAALFPPPLCIEQWLDCFIHSMKQWRLELSGVCQISDH